MAKPPWHTRWTVLPHEPIRKLEPDLWEVEGALEKMPITRRMVLVRLHDGRVVVHNAVSLEEPLMAKLEAWGKPSFLIVPNSFHRLDAWCWTQRYPGIAVLAGPSGQKAIAKAVSVVGGVELLPLGGGLVGEDLAGTKVGEMAFVQTHADARKTLVLNDVFWNEPHHPGLSGLLFRALGSTGGPRVTRVMKLAGIADRRATKAHLLRLAAIPGLARIIMAHGRIVESDAGAILKEAAERFL